MGGHEPAPRAIPTTEISREALFDLQRTKGNVLTKALRAVGRVTYKLVLFPLPGLSSVRLAHLRGDPAMSLTKHMAVGTGLGLVLGAAWRYWHVNIFNVRRDDYYKQLAIANAKENENFRQKLIAEARQVSLYNFFFY